MHSLKTIARKGLIAICAIGAFAVGSVQAATSNPAGPGPTSTGTVDVQVSVGALVWIQGLETLDVGNYTPGAGDLTDNDGFCVWTNQGSGDFQITVTSASTTMTASSGTDAVSYITRLDLDDTNAADGTAVTDGDTLTGSLLGPGTFPPPTCNTDNAAVHVTFEETGNLDGATAGVYTDELTLFVEPN